uniref:Uncharacterized protein n=1 Tax=Andraca bipunctata granulovirus TaxID=270494 RepID=B5A7L4_9BBAC|nr:hypothetical protein [Andraca bipunctata granulovirus]
MSTMKIVCDAIKTMGDEDETLEAVQNIPTTSELDTAYTDIPGLDGNFISELTYNTGYNTGYFTSTDYNNNNNNNNNNNEYIVEDNTNQQFINNDIINNAINALTNDNFITNANTTITNNESELELERMLNEVHNGSSVGGGVVSNEALEIVITTKPVTCVENVYDYDKLHAQTRNDLQQCFKLIDEQKENIRQINEAVECKDKIIKKKNEREKKWQSVLEKMQQQNDQLTAKLTHEQKSTCEQDVQTENYTQKEHNVQTDKECVDVRSVKQQTKILMTNRQVQTDFDDIEVDNCRVKETDMLNVQQKYEELQEQFNRLKNKHDELVISESRNKLKRHAVEQTLTDGYKKFKNSVLETFDEMETRQKKMNDQKATIQKQEQMIAELQKQNAVLLDTYRQTKECVKTVNNKLIQSQNVVAFYKNECASIRQKYNNLLKK